MKKKTKRGNTKNTPELKEKIRSCYSRIEDIALSIFKLVLRGDLKALIIKGNYSDEELEKIKQDLLNEFFSSIESKGMKAYVENLKSIMILENKLFRLSSLINLSKQGVDVLESLKNQFRVSDIKKAEARYKKLHLDYQIKLKEQKSDKKQNNTNLFEYFSELQIAVSQKMVYVIKDNDITLYDFSLMVKRYLK